MKRYPLAFLLILALSLVSLPHAQAVPLNVEVPDNAYITLNGFDWAWANPLPGGVDLTFQGQFGWRLPTLAELGLAPDAADFLFDGANVPYNGTDPVSGATFQATNASYDSFQSAGAVAVPYFSLTYLHADWQDGQGQTYEPWAGLPNAETFADQLVVRNSAIPEPTTMLLLGTGLIGMAFARRKFDNE